MRKLLYEYGRLNWLYLLFVLNVAGFLIAFFATLFTNGASNNFFAIHSDDNFSLVKIWKLATYSFADIDVRSFLYNLIWLWVFGEVLSSIYGTKKVFDVYCIAILVIGIVAGICCLFNTNFIIYLIGFSPAVIAIVSATIYKAPQHKVALFFGGSIPIWILGVAFYLLYIFFNPSKELAFMLLINFLAIPVGIIYVVLLDKGSAILQWNPFKKKPVPKGKLVAFANTQKAAPKNTNQQQLDKILEKISAKGLESLTKEEKSFLEKYAKD